MNDEELKEKETETKALKIELPTEHKSRRNQIDWISGVLCVFLCVSACALCVNFFLLTERAGGRVVVTGSLREVFGGWLEQGYRFAIPLVLMGIACGLPFFRHKIMVVAGLLLNVFFWIGGLVAMFLFYRSL